jgi:stalled ribosome rescue protein Dom34
VIQSTKAFEEVKALGAFFGMMNKDPDKAFYGYDDVRMPPNERGEN